MLSDARLTRKKKKTTNNNKEKRQTIGLRVCSSGDEGAGEMYGAFIWSYRTAHASQKALDAYIQKIPSEQTHHMPYSFWEYIFLTEKTDF